ncbi:MAG TPA: SIS domain-containing protein [Gaiellales bacterium]|nr:SIS domain-containing protein [Gaiellales bacterium]
MADRALRRLQLHAEMAAALVTAELAAALESCAVDIAGRLEAGGTLVLFGNGGSAADAHHVAAEFTGRYLLEREPLPAVALAENAAAVTAIGNDYGFDQVFARQVRAFGNDGGAAIALSTSGASANVLEGLRAARELGLLTIGVTGEGGAERMRALCDHLLTIPAEQTPQIQEGTLLVLHTICELVEHSQFGG